jgi:hypothetical protein
LIIRRAAVAVFIAGVLLPASGHAQTLQGELSLKRWARSDKCAQQAQHSFPDYTAEAQAKRNLAYEQCIDSQNLPPRQLPMPGQQ